MTDNSTKCDCPFCNLINVNLTTSGEVVVDIRNIKKGNFSKLCSCVKDEELHEFVKFNLALIVLDTKNKYNNFKDWNNITKVSENDDYILEIRQPLKDYFKISFKTLKKHQCSCDCCEKI